MSTDPLLDARSALSAGHESLAIDLALKAVQPAVITHDARVINAARELAEEPRTVDTYARRHAAAIL